MTSTGWDDPKNLYHDGRVITTKESAKDLNKQKLDKVAPQDH